MLWKDYKCAQKRNFILFKLWLSSHFCSSFFFFFFRPLTLRIKRMNTFDLQWKQSHVSKYDPRQRDPVDIEIKLKFRMCQTIWNHAEKNCQHSPKRSATYTVWTSSLTEKNGSSHSWFSLNCLEKWQQDYIWNHSHRFNQLAAQSGKWKGKLAYCRHVKLFLTSVLRLL